jgi:hypothetical protein
VVSSRTVIDQPHKRNGSPSCYASNKAHLHTTLDTRNDVVPAAPTPNDTGLDVPKRKQRNSHNANTPVQRHDDLLDHEVGDKRDETSNEIPDGESDGRDPSLVAIRLGLLVMERDEELKKAIVRCMQRRVDLRDGGFRQTVSGECIVDDGAGLDRRGLDQLFCFADSRLI